MAGADKNGAGPEAAVSKYAGGMLLSGEGKLQNILHPSVSDQLIFKYMYLPTSPYLSLHVFYGLYYSLLCKIHGIILYIIVRRTPNV